MASLSIASTPAELYNTVLVDTPLGMLCVYHLLLEFIFVKQGFPFLLLTHLAMTIHCLDSTWFAASFFESCVAEQDLDELNIEIIRSTLYKVRTTSGAKRRLRFSTA
jgi:hypothetical protein